MLKLIFDEQMLKMGPPPFKPAEINNLFGFLRYPYTIRNDAITAVGSPGSIGFLAKALYWLYILAAVHVPLDDEESAASVGINTIQENEDSQMKSSGEESKEEGENGGSK